MTASTRALLVFAIAGLLFAAGCHRSRGPRPGDETPRLDAGTVEEDGGGAVDAGPTFLATYEPCAFSEDCTPADECVEITVTNPSGRTVTDGMCTHGCVDDLDCPISPGSGLAGACYEVGGAPALCYERCDFDSDCPIGFGCYPTTGVPDAICLPL